MLGNRTLDDDRQRHLDDHNIYLRSLSNACIPITAFGAKAQPGFDNASAIQAALDATDVGAVLVPAGTFEVHSTIETKRSGATLVGVGRELSILDYRGSGPCLLFGRGDYEPGANENYKGLHLADIGFVGTTTGSGAVQVTGATRWTIERVHIRSFVDGYGVGLIDYGWIGSLRDCRIETCQYGVRADVGESGGQSANAITITGGEIGPGCTYGVVIGDETALVKEDPVLGSVINLHGVTIEGTNDLGLWVVSGNVVNVRDCYFEDCDGGSIRLGNGSIEPFGVHISGNWFAGFELDGTICVDIQGGDFITVQQNHIGLTSDGSTTGIKARNANRLRVRDNFISPGVVVDYDIADSDYILETMIGREQFSHSGFTYASNQSHVIRVVDSEGIVMLEISPSGRLVMRDELTGELRTVRMVNGVLTIL